MELTPDIRPRQTQIFFVNKFSWLDHKPMSLVTTMMCHALASQGHHVRLYMEGSPEEDTDRALESWFNLRPLPTLEVALLPRKYKNNRKSKSAMGFYCKVSQDISARARPDARCIVITRNSNFLPFLLLLKLRRKVEAYFEAHSYHGNTSIPGVKLPPRHLLRGTNSVYALWERISLNRLDGLVCITGPQEALYRADGLRIKSITLPLGAPEPEPGGVPSVHSPYIVYMGRATGLVDYRMVMEGLLLCKDPSISFLWIGISGKEARDVQSMAESLGVAPRVRTMEWQSQTNLRSILKTQCRIGLACYQNDYETAVLVSPTKIFDYYSVGLPVIAPDLPTISSVMTDGCEGMLYETGNPASFATALDAVSGDPQRYEAMVRNSLAAARRYSWRNRAAAFMSFADSQGCRTASRNPMT